MTRTGHHDTVVVGGRCAGAATAMLLARAGQRVLVLDAGRAGTDTLSTHGLLRGGVVQLHRWGLLDAVLAAGTPPVTRSQFYLAGGITQVIELRPAAGVSALVAPRRTVLDPILTAAAADAGADVRFGVRVTGVLRGRANRVVGVEGIQRGTRARWRATADLTVGADGRRSTVAAAVRTATLRRGGSAGSYAYGYWSGAQLTDRYRFWFPTGCAAGAIPTNDGLLCVWIGTTPARFGVLCRDLAAGYRTLLGEVAPDLARDLADARLDGPVRGFPGAPGHLRAGTGPGWALVGDAGCFVDPIAAHGITGALRDAELLARAVLDPDRDTAQARYQRTRDELSEPLLAIGDRMASLRWDTAEIQRLLVGLARAMKPEIHALTALDPPRTDREERT